MIYQSLESDRKGLKIPRSQERAGSSPAASTTLKRNSRN